MLNPQGITNLPIELAIDKGYFDKANIDLQVEQNNGSSVQQLPRLARGDLDVIPVTPSAALYNQLTQGFDVKVIGPEGTEKTGRLDQVWLAVLPDTASQYTDLSSLRNKTIEGAILGSGISVLVELAIRQAGLVNGQTVNVQYRARTLPEIVQLAQSKGADVFGCSEPLATQGVQQGVWVKWKSIADVVPWYQPGLLAASEQSLSGSRRDAVVKWMEVYLYACREINASNGVWAPDVLNSATRWAQLEPKVITDQGAAPYFDPNGAISMESLGRVQQLWQELGQVPQPVDIQQMVDASIPGDASQHLGIFPA